MLTRLKVSGFKNLVDVDVRFGPFTCIAGANGVGKSNLFDAIRFMSALADKPLVDAALSVRDEGNRTSDLRSLFHRVGDKYADKISLEAEMILPEETYDELGGQAKANTTAVKYCVEVAYREDDSLHSLGSLELLKEELTPLNPDFIAHHPCSDEWIASVLKRVSQRRTSPLISTQVDAGQRVIRQHQDGRSGPKQQWTATALPRTVLSVVNDAERPTLLAARRELQSWRLLQLEPSSLRRPSEFAAPAHLGADGSSLSATLYRLANLKRNAHITPVVHSVYSSIASRLAELIDDVSMVWVDRDETRGLLTLQIVDRNGTPHPSQVLSDGTLRFLALAVLEADPEAQGTLCLEEPENGIHPERIPAMLELLRDIATDCREPIGSDNPLRQVIVNTHSPSVVAQIPDDSLLIAELREQIDGDQRFKHPVFSWLPGTWRSEKEPDVRPVSRGKLLSYLNPNVPYTPANGVNDHHHRSPRVMDRDDLQMLLPFPTGAHE